MGLIQETLHRYLLTLIAGLMLGQHAECCNRQPSMITTPFTPTSDVTEYITTPTSSSVILRECDAELDTSVELFYRCRFGVCVVEVNTEDDSKLSYCRCDSGFAGRFCQTKNRVILAPQPSLALSGWRGSRSGDIIAIIFACIILVISILLICFTEAVYRAHSSSVAKQCAKQTGSYYSNDISRCSHTEFQQKCSQCSLCSLDHTTVSDCSWCHSKNKVVTLEHCPASRGKRGNNSQKKYGSQLASVLSTYYLYKNGDNKIRRYHLHRI